MRDSQIFDRLFGCGQHDIRINGHFVSGEALVDKQPVVVIGTWDAAAVDGDLALAVSAEILRVVAEDAEAGCAPRTIVFIADTQGQALSRHEELLGLNGCFAHVARCVDLARRSGHATLTLIYGEAVSGGFLAFGMLADYVCALPEAQVRVMDLRAMARVTRIGLDRLQGLARESPVFAPGAENYWRMGAIQALWPDGDGNWNAQLALAISAAKSAGMDDPRTGLGIERGGRTLAARVAVEVAHG